MNPTMAIGAATKNTEPYQKCSSKNPPINGPIAPPAPANPAHTAIALARSRGGKDDCSRLSVAGMISAAPMPMRARMAMSELAESITAHNADETAKITRPINSAPLRPNRSPSAPAGSSRAAKTSAYASTIHRIWVSLGFSSDWARLGMATLTELTVATISTRLRHIVARISHRRWYT